MFHFYSRRGGEAAKIRGGRGVYIFIYFTYSRVKKGHSCYFYCLASGENIICSEPQLRGPYISMIFLLGALDYNTSLFVQRVPGFPSARGIL